MHPLVYLWRTQAQHAVSHYEGGTLLRCADELERSHHDEEHNMAWVDGCLICDREQDDGLGS